VPAKDASRRAERRARGLRGAFFGGAGAATRMPFRYRWGNDADAVLSAAMDLSRTRAIGVQVGHRTFIAPVT